MRNQDSCWGSFRLSGVAQAALLLVLWGSGPALTGCSGPGERRTSPAAGHGVTSPVRVETVADWDDVEAAVSVALRRTELVLAAARRPEEGRMEFRLRSSRDEPGLLVVTRGVATGDGGPVPMTLTCSVGRFGDVRSEQQLLAFVVERLTQLRGVEVAPIKP